MCGKILKEKIETPHMEKNIRVLVIIPLLLRIHIAASTFFPFFAPKVFIIGIFLSAPTPLPISI